jgi:uncharacterized membrane protein YhaH (DUF805 family)
MIDLYNGRIGRFHYCLYLFSTVILYYFFDGTLNKNSVIYIASEIVLLLFILIFILPLHVRRLHDLGRSGWFVLLLAVPFINIFVGLYLLLFLGNLTKNPYGPPSKKNLLNDFLNK